MEYPKIQTVFERDEQTRKVILGKLRLPEFGLISHWMVTEKIDGTNLRVHLKPDGSVAYGGRTDAAQLHASLVEWLQVNLPADRVSSAFDPNTEAWLFGEGYGPKIQKGGLYRSAVSFRLFDVVVVGANRLWWLTLENVIDVARKLGVVTVPVIGSCLDFASAVAMVQRPSTVAKEDGGVGCEQEGIVCRTDPPVFDRRGERLIWKLKLRDF